MKRHAQRKSVLRAAAVVAVCLVAALTLPTRAGATVRARAEVSIFFQLDFGPGGMRYDFESFHEVRFISWDLFEGYSPVYFAGAMYKDSAFNVKSLCAGVGIVSHSVFQCVLRKRAYCMSADGVWYSNVEATVFGLPPQTFFDRTGPVYANCFDPGQICIPAPDDPLECGGSPIVIDLGGDNFTFTGLDDPVYFDIDADHELEAVGWTSEFGNDGFLAMDRDGDRRITSGAELFGDATLLADGELAPNGYSALAELDSVALGGDGNGRIDRRDRGFRRLRIWLDENRDGISQRRELKPLKKHGIRWISLDYFESQLVDEHGNRLVFASPVKLKDKKWVWSTDVYFVVEDE